MGTVGDVATAEETSEGGSTRLIPLEGTFNFRDLGGYPTTDGRRTRWRRLYRSDGLQQLSAADVAELRARGVSAVVDLRTSDEIERWGRGLLEAEPMHWEHLTIIGNGRDAGESVAAPVTNDLAERYLWYLEIGRASMVRALELAATHAPLVFHCSAGKDRTGVLSALILDAVGVPAEVIVADYALTGEHLGAILERLLGQVAPEPRPAVPDSRLRVEAATMTRFLERLHERAGGAAAWAIDAGVAPGTIDRLRAELLEG